MTRTRPRVLLAVTVYNGEHLVRRTLESATHIDQAEADVDVLVLDDASPAPGFSGRLEGLCRELGVHYYGSPRNLGIPRNFSLGMLVAQQNGYSHVIIANSDVIFPTNLVSQLLRVAQQERIGSVTAWSNNVSAFSLPNDDPDAHLADQGVVDEVSDALAAHYGDAAMFVPTAVGFCFMVPTAVIDDIGVMDPVFARGYCEEVDWSLRSVAAGYRTALAPGTFVYHQGQGSNVAAGILELGSTTVDANEAIIDMRYPLYRSQVKGFMSSDILGEARKYGTIAILQAAGRHHGYSLEVGWLPATAEDDDLVRCTIAPDGLSGDVEIAWRGFSHTMDVDPFHVRTSLRGFFDGADPLRVNLHDRGALAAELGDTFGDAAVRTTNYPARI